MEEKVVELINRSPMTIKLDKEVCLEELMACLSDEERRTIYCSNLDDAVTAPLLYELFLQSGPIVKIVRPLFKPKSTPSTKKSEKTDKKEDKEKGKEVKDRTSNKETNKIDLASELVDEGVEKVNVDVLVDKDEVGVSENENVEMIVKGGDSDGEEVDPVTEVAKMIEKTRVLEDVIEVDNNLEKEMEEERGEMKAEETVGNQGLVRKAVVGEDISKTVVENGNKLEAMINKMSLVENTLNVQDSNKKDKTKPEEVKIPVHEHYALIIFQHEVAVKYSMALFDGTCLFGRKLYLGLRNPLNLRVQRREPARPTGLPFPPPRFHGQRSAVGPGQYHGPPNNNMYRPANNWQQNLYRRPANTLWKPNHGPVSGENQGKTNFPNPNRTNVFNYDIFEITLPRNMGSLNSGLSNNSWTTANNLPPQMINVTERIINPSYNLGHLQSANVLVPEACKNQVSEGFATRGRVVEGQSRDVPPSTSPKHGIDIQDRYPTVHDPNTDSMTPASRRSPGDGASAPALGRGGGGYRGYPGGVTYTGRGALARAPVPHTSVSQAWAHGCGMPNTGRGLTNTVARATPMPPARAIGRGSQGTRMLGVGRGIPRRGGLVADNRNVGLQPEAWRFVCEHRGPRLVSTSRNEPGARTSSHDVGGRDYRPPYLLATPPSAVGVAHDEGGRDYRPPYLLPTPPRAVGAAHDVGGYRPPYLPRAVGTAHDVGGYRPPYLPRAVGTLHDAGGYRPPYLPRAVGAAHDPGGYRPPYLPRAVGAATDDDRHGYRRPPPTSGVGERLSQWRRQEGHGNGGDGQRPAG